MDLDYGNPIDWQLNPLTGKRCNEKQKWYKIPDFDKRVVDDKRELRAERKTDKSFRRRLVELATYEAEFALKSYLKVGECA